MYTQGVFEVCQERGLLLAEIAEGVSLEQPLELPFR